jgi:hypothetical protein
MTREFPASDRRLGVVSAIAVVVLEVLYAVTLSAGLLSLPSPEDPIGDPLFSILEILILLLMPAMVVLMVAVHAWASAKDKVYGVAALVFMSVVAGITSAVHFVLLTVSRSDAVVALPPLSRQFAFRWPSVVYALDILAWDVFFALAVLFSAPVFSGSPLARWIRWLLILSGILALAGLIGVVTGDMGLRNIGIVGYSGVFPVAALLLALLFHRTRAAT